MAEKRKIRKDNPVTYHNYLLKKQEERWRGKSKYIIEPINGEVWRDVVGFEGRYLISNFGRIKSILQVTKKEKPIKIFLERGYYRVRLYGDSSSKFYRIHRLVAEAFIPNTDRKETVNHIDGNKLNNNASNLEWASRSDQIVHAIKNNLRRKATRAKVNEEKVREIRKHFGIGKTNVAIASELGVSVSIVSSIKNNKRWYWVK